MYAYRVEHKQCGIGPYMVDVNIFTEEERHVYYKVLTWMCNNWGDPEHSTITADCVLPYTEERWYIAATNSIEKLTNWWDTTVLGYLADIGFILAIYQFDPDNSDQVRVGKDQIAIHMKLCSIVDRMNLSDLIKLMQ